MTPTRISKPIVWIVTIACISVLVVNSARSEAWNDLLNHADSLAELKQLDSALSVGKQALDVLINSDVKCDTCIMAAKDALARFSFLSGDYDKGIQFCREALDIARSALGEESGRSGDLRSKLAWQLRRAGHHAQAVLEMDKALQNLKVAHGNLSHEVMRAHRTLGVWCQEDGLLLLANRHDVAALQVGIQVLDSDDPFLSKLHLNLGASLRRLGRFADAERSYREALAVYAMQEAPDSVGVASVLNNLGSVCFYQGRLQEAEEFYEKALSIRMNVKGPHDWSTLETLENLANVLSRAGRQAEADSLYGDLLRLSVEIGGPDNPELIITYGNLGVALANSQRLDSAITLLSRAIELSRTHWPPNHPYTAIFLYSLGDALLWTGNIEKADSVARIALRIQDSSLPEYHLDKADTYRLLALAGVAAQNFDEAVLAAQRAFDIRLKNFYENVDQLGEDQTLAFADELHRSASTVVATVLADPTPPDSAPELVHNVVTAAKGIVTQEMFARGGSREFSSPDSCEHVSEDLALALEMQFLLESGGSSSDDSVSERQVLDSLRQNVLELKERVAACSNRHLGALKSIRSVSGQTTRQSIPDNCTFLDFFLYESHHEIFQDSGIGYIAIVSDSRGVRSLVDYGSAYKIDTAIYRWRDHIYQISEGSTTLEDASMRECDSICRSLHAKLFLPVSKYIPDSNWIAVSPDGSLSLLSFACLLDSVGQYLIDRFPLHQLSSGKDFARLFEMADTRNPGVAVFADPAFSSSIPKALTSLAVRSDCDALVGSEMRRLGHTRVEASIIDSLWRNVIGTPPDMYLGQAASEKNFRTYSVGHGIVHVATHGYYLPGQCVGAVDTISGPSTTHQEATINPLILTGLVLSGSGAESNTGTQNGYDDGVLTALDIAQLDFRGTALVVLSSCESALGTARRGEDPRGLRRSFQVAGARTVVSALWKVSDQFTAEMMSALYEDMDKPIYDRMRDVQLRQIENLRKAGIPPHPYLWGAFIATGDWR